MAKKENTPHAGKDHRKRAKQQFRENGITGLSEHRALELLLFYGMPQGEVLPIAHALIETFGDFPAVLNASYDELCQVKGVGEHTATLIQLVTAMHIYYGIKQSETILTVNSPETAFDILSPYFLDAKNEKVFVLCLDAERRYLGTRAVGEGSLLSVGFSFRNIAKEAMTLGAVRIYVAHNHVTGTLEPSDADWDATTRLIQTLHPLEIYVEDHLVIGKQEKASLRQISREKRIALPWPQ